MLPELITSPPRTVEWVMQHAPILTSFFSCSHIMLYI